jgi:hypothetical protein
MQLNNDNILSFFEASQDRKKIRTALTLVGQIDNRLKLLKEWSTSYDIDIIRCGKKDDLVKIMKEFLKNDGIKPVVITCNSEYFNNKPKYIIKELLSSDPVYCKPLYINPIEFIPKVNLIIETDDMAFINNLGDDIKKRLAIVEFNNIKS